MKIKHLTTAVLLFFQFSAFAQTDVKRMIIKDLYVQTGSFVERNTNGTLADFKTLAPQSVLLNRLPANNFTNVIGNTNSSMFSVMMSIKFSDKEKAAFKSNPLLRLGFSYLSGNGMTGWSSTQKDIPYDTLSSTKTGNSIYVDSINTKQYGIDYTTEQLRLDASMIFRLKPEARWSLYAGVGLMAGLSINSSTDIYYNEYFRLVSRYPDGYSQNYGRSSTIETQSESFKNKTNMGFTIHVPMGVDFRIGKKGFWNQMHLFYELRRGINMTSIPELRTYTNASSQHGIGLRVSWE